MLLIAFNIVFFFAFVAFAAVQINDPDPWLWAGIYLYAALWCGLAVFGIFSTVGYALGLLVYVPYAAYLFFAKDGVWDWATKHRAASITASMKAEQPWIEKTREFFGLLIAVAVLLVNFFALAGQS